MLAAHCPVCSDENNKHCPTNEAKSGLCWNQQHCQVKCNCQGNVCTKTGKCCDPSCVGGCDEDDQKKCKACKRFSITEGDNIKCSDQCPEGTYEVRICA